ncbi:putative transporter subunit: ATP-binding component of ABC superfamily transporter [Acetoanaerobium sticklandii]|uniref:Quaternary amine transport ATP-binding protein n=1 Tax=Acetoanaerobium sticklandii (strain ATCC 12662 / DSM 519 / JCM 1433 / CCUG 9281 / NCIMB 10654 / HF) TaxID=499177 RepID=E3PRA6_ACESD|nr:betaine/proline/choline family ABC transporter ATP-binding protein [Acetoanaerobium sticklandii]CBH20168.1 putative transporter subunit: ATP-binding component of ABC superfamily transporter [Acetoanaerobium sticklandii]
MIRFENVVKKYNELDKMAVDNLNLHIKKGEICMLLGPSGCGKTTTMKMINKLIKSTSGNIYIDDKNIDKVDPIKLRLSIGYVIQGTGLFPHMTIGENIAMVPKELGWDKARIDARIDELLELMELDPKVYKDKRPKDLSGGQRQRVGVARALAADPPVMLMDEPFGALDPITRGKLQDEFLRVQEKLGKTIVFVTHDIDEAIKMGDKIAIMKEGKLVQYASPAEILSQPADDFVAELIGGNGAIKMMNLIKCKDVLRKLPNIDIESESILALNLMKEQGVRNIIVKDKNHKILGYVRYKDAFKNQNASLADILNEIGETVSPGTTLKEALSLMFSMGRKAIFISKEKGSIDGIITMDDLLKAVNDDEQDEDTLS